MGNEIRDPSEKVARINLPDDCSVILIFFQYVGITRGDVHPADTCSRSLHGQTGCSYLQLTMHMRDIYFALNKVPRQITPLIHSSTRWRRFSARCTTINEQK